MSINIEIPAFVAKNNIRKNINFLRNNVWRTLTSESTKPNEGSWANHSNQT